VSELQQRWRFPPTFALWVVRRGLLIWLLVRAVTTTLGAIMSNGDVSAQLPGTVRSQVLTLLLVVGLSLLESRRRNELLLFANAGVSPWRVALATGLMPFCFELGLRVVA
jgi:hypothetical protein